MLISPITCEILREYLGYNPETGQFKRLKKSSIKDIVGTFAGSVAKAGNIDIRLLGRLYRAHRLAWLWMTGEWPRWGIDHINGDSQDNRWINLRDIPQNINMQNIRRAHRDSKLGFLGVDNHKGNKFRARIKHNYKAIFLGLFDTPEEAHEAYKIAKRKLHKGCTI